MKKIYVVGNLLVEMDSLPIKLVPELKEMFPGIDFIEFDPSEDFKLENKKLIIIDTVINANKVRVITDIDKIITEKACSLHDFDLGHNLKIMKKFGMIDSVKIIGVPPNISENEALRQVKKAITSLSSESG